MNPLSLGFDNYSIRALGWDATALIDYAAKLKLEVLLLSDLKVFRSLDEEYLRDLRQHAADLHVQLQVGTLSVCPGSVLFDPSTGSAEDQLQATIRVARLVGSPIARCVLGKIDDRRGRGGIRARIAEMVAVLKSARAAALDSRVKIAVENHAGDLRSSELIELIEQAGPDYVGALIDAGNAVWALESPLGNLAALAPYALSTGIRDSALWETPEGLVLQWTAVGQGMINWTTYFERLRQLAPGVPAILEIISGRPNPIPFWNPGFWQAYPGVDAADFVSFLALARGGKPRAPFNPAGSESPAAVGEFQLRELESSVEYCRRLLNS